MSGYPGNDEKGRELQAQVDLVKLMNDFFAAIDFLKAHPAGSGKVGITGFCYGAAAELAWQRTLDWLQRRFAPGGIQ